MWISLDLLFTHLDGKVDEDGARVVGSAVQAVGGHAQVGVGEEISQLVLVDPPIVDVSQPQVALRVLAPALVFRVWHGSGGGHYRGGSHGALLFGCSTRKREADYLYYQLFWLHPGGVGYTKVG